MGMRPDDFADLTPAEFFYAWAGWAKADRDKRKEAWERTRWEVWVLTCIQLEKKDRKDMTAMFPLPWEHTAEQMTPTPSAELTQEERQKRINELLQCIKQDKQ